MSHGIQILTYLTRIQDSLLHVLHIHVRYLSENVFYMIFFYVITKEKKWFWYVDSTLICEKIVPRIDLIFYLSFF